MLLKTTPFYPRTSKLLISETWKRWAGYVAATSYELSHDREYAAIRNSAALFDVTPLYKYAITGPDASKLLNRVITRDIDKLAIGQVYYTPWCDAQGKVIDDGTVARLGEQNFRMTSAEANLRWLHMNALKLNVDIKDVTREIAAVSLQGPTSRDILQALDADVADLKYFRIKKSTIKNIPVEISRTGYTGDLGYEIWTDNASALALWDALMQAGSNYGILPAGLLALDIARNEAGLILLDVDYVSARHALIDAQFSSPFEVNLGWAVAKDKVPFVGQRALMKERANPSGWRFVGVDVDWESLEHLYNSVGLPPRIPGAAWRMSVPIYKSGKQIGYATSGAWSPVLKKYIALAHVQNIADDTAVEFEVTVEHKRKNAAAKIVKLPFFDPPRKRA